MGWQCQRKECNKFYPNEHYRHPKIVVKQNNWLNRF
jgi:hypothetical protein